MKTIVVTMYGKEYQELASYTIPNLDAYCDKHEYDQRIIFVEGNDWEYKKHEMFKKLFEEGYELICYRDIDAIYTNLNVPYESLIDNEHDLFITKDYNEINGGSLIIKNTEGGKIVNDAILVNRNNFENEQNAINFLMQSPQFNQHVRVIPQCLINAYLYELYPEIGKLSISQGQWGENAFILHVPALPISKRLEVLKSAKVTE